MGKLIAGINDLNTLSPEIAIEWHPTKNGNLKPEKISRTSHIKAWWKCSVCGFEWSASVANRTNRHSGCPKCCFEKRNSEKRKTLIALRGSFREWCEKNSKTDLLDQWDYQRNGELTPDIITMGYEKKVHWKCDKCGYQWDTSVNNRVGGHGCPLCSNRVVIAGINDLFTTYPELSKDWDYGKNTADPLHITFGSEKKVWWKCSVCGNSWEASPNERTSHKGLSCPYCKHRRVIPEKTSLIAKYPELVEEWDYDRNKDSSPDTIFPNSKREVYWKCSSCGFSWAMTPEKRINGGYCPQCGIRTKTSFPEQAIYYYIKLKHEDAVLHYNEIFPNTMELDIYIPSIKTGIEYDGKAWHNTKSSENRELRKYEICHKNEIKLIRVKEEISADYENHSDVVIHAEYDRNHLELFDNTLNELGRYISMGDHDCKRDELLIRREYYQTARCNRFSEINSKLLSEWDYDQNGFLTPEMITTGSADNVHWKCKLGHQWVAPVYNRIKGHGCPYCSNQKVWKGYNDLVSASPALAKEWNSSKNSLKPEEVYHSSNKKYWWKCSSCGYEWESSPRNRYVLNHGCPACVGNVVISGRNDLATIYPDIASEWDYEKNEDKSPMNFLPSSKKKMWWKCEKCGCEWQGMIVTRVNGKNCPKCFKEKKS